MNIDQAFQQAVEHQRAGELEEAVALYQSILQADPRHAEANHNMGVIAVQVGQPAGGLSYFVMALEGDPSRGQYWLSYIDALYQAGQLDDARQMLGLAQQQGLTGDEVEALAAVMEGGTQIAQQPDADSRHASGRSPATPSADPKNGQMKPKGKSVKQERSDRDTARYRGKCPNAKEIDSLVDLFGQGRFAEAATLAKTMTARFPLHEFGWKALGAALKQMGRTSEALVPMQKAAALSPRDVEAHYNLGVTLQELGRLDEAESSYQQALRINPDYAQAHSNLGVILQESGRLDEAEASYRHTLRINPNHAKAHSNLGVVLQKLGRLEEAEANHRRAMQIDQGNPETHGNLGNTLKDLGRLDEAETCYRRAIEIKPDFVEAHYNLGNTLKEMDRLDEAETCYRRAVEIKPDYAEVHYNLGNTLVDLDRLEEAGASYRRAVEIKPDYSEAHYNLGKVLVGLDRLEEAEACYLRTIEIKPDYVEAHYNLGTILYKQRRMANAEASFLRAIKIKPDYAAAHAHLGACLASNATSDKAEASYRRALEIRPDWAELHLDLGNELRNLGRLEEAKTSYRNAQEMGLAQARIKEALMLPAIMGTRREMLESRAEFERRLDKLIADRVTLDDPLKAAMEPNFYLAFHGLNDRDLQVKVARYYEQACPGLLYTAPHCLKPESTPREKIRIGFFSKFLYRHSVSLCFSKMIEAFSLKDQFQVSLISSGAADAKLYSGFVGERVRVPADLIEARKIVAELELDILMYLDIGMEPMSYFLAFARLAPVQCVTSGHPVTTGIANMDYFLSAEQTEPPGADQHYSENLVRLPRPLACFAPPALPTRLKTRSELNLPVERHIYMCPMTLQKLHPDFDEAIGRILQIDSNGVVVLFEDRKWSWWKEALVKRLESTIPADVLHRIIFLPWLTDYFDFISAVAAADVLLDPFHFGIGSTMTVAAVAGTPLVTRPGEFMRGRVGKDYCEMFDVVECVTKDTEDYARKAVEIANDPLLRERISARILKNNSALFEDMQPAEDLADFFQSLVKGGRFA